MAIGEKNEVSVRPYGMGVIFHRAQLEPSWNCSGLTIRMKCDEVFEIFISLLLDMKHFEVTELTRNLRSGFSFASIYRVD